MSYDEIEIEDMAWNESLAAYTYSCPCGDLFQIGLDDLRSGEEIARCPSCSLYITVIYDPEDFEGDKPPPAMLHAKVPKEESVTAAARNQTEVAPPSADAPAASSTDVPADALIASSTDVPADVPAASSTASPADASAAACAPPHAASASATSAVCPAPDVVPPISSAPSDTSLESQSNSACGNGSAETNASQATAEAHISSLGLSDMASSGLATNSQVAVEAHMSSLGLSDMASNQGAAFAAQPEREATLV